MDPTNKRRPDGEIVGVCGFTGSKHRYDGPRSSGGFWVYIASIWCVGQWCPSDISPFSLTERNNARQTNAVRIPSVKP